jgi:hypothetical protein
MGQAWRKRYGIHRDDRDDPRDYNHRISENADRAPAPEDREAEEMKRSYALRDDSPGNR